MKKPPDDYRGAIEALDLAVADLKNQVFLVWEGTLWGRYTFWVADRLATVLAKITRSNKGDRGL